MVNLLPPSEKDNLRAEENYRLVLILGLLLLLFLVSLFLILSSVKIYLAGQAAAQKILVDFEEEKLKTLEIQELEEKISLINDNLFKLDAFYQDKSRWNEKLAKISATAPPGAYLTFLSLGPSPEKGKLQASLYGYSQTREILFGFKKGLEAQPDFKGIYFPPANWVKPENIDFITNFEIEL